MIEIGEGVKRKKQLNERKSASSEIQRRSSCWTNRGVKTWNSRVFL